MAEFKCERPPMGDSPTTRTTWERKHPPLVGVRAIAPGERDNWTKRQTEAWDDLISAGIILVAAFDGLAVNAKNDYTEPKKAS